MNAAQVRAAGRALAAALKRLGAGPHATLWTSSMPGRSATAALPGYGFHLPGGRALSVAAGAKAFVPALTVVCAAPGDLLAGAGAGDLLLAARRESAVTCLALGAGPGVGAAALAASAGAAFAARVPADDSEGAVALLERGLRSRGFAVIEAVPGAEPAVLRDAPIVGGLTAPEAALTRRLTLTARERELLLSTLL